MIFDQENMYLDKATISGSTTSNVLYNMGGGDAHDPLFLVAVATEPLSGAATAKLETSDTEAFEAATTLGEFTLAGSAKGVLLRAKLPYGMKKYSRVVVSGATSGKLTVGLTETVPNWP